MQNEPYQEKDLAKEFTFRAVDFQRNPYQFNHFELAAALANLPSGELEKIMDFLQEEHYVPYGDFVGDGVQNRFFRILDRLVSNLAMTKEGEEYFLPGFVVAHNADGSWEALDDLDREDPRLQALEAPFNGCLAFIQGTVLYADPVTPQQMVEFGKKVLQLLVPDREIVLKQEGDWFALFDTEGREYFFSGDWEVTCNVSPMPKDE